MKVRNSFKKMVLAGALVGFSMAASASTYYDNMTTSFNLVLGLDCRKTMLATLTWAALTHGQSIFWDQQV
jgi:hypothetical protein